MRWLDTFGQLIGNTDRHFGNLALFTAANGQLRLAPAYDMLPMILAPSGEAVVAREFQPRAPSGENLDVWPNAAEWALSYWREVQDSSELEPEVREFARRAIGKVSDLADRVSPERGPPQRG